MLFLSICWFTHHLFDPQWMFQYLLYYHQSVRGKYESEYSLKAHINWQFIISSLFETYHPLIVQDSKNASDWSSGRMSLLISGSIQDVLSIKLKHRSDSFTDQFSRIFMVKMLIISSLITSMEFFSDTVSCIVPNQSGSLNLEFVHSACWIMV